VDGDTLVVRRAGPAGRVGANLARDMPDSKGQKAEQQKIFISVDVLMVFYELPHFVEM